MKYILDAQKMLTREDAHEYLQEILGLPEYYGRNLDALYDCLSDMEEIEFEIQNVTEDNILLLRIVKVMKAAGAKVEFV